MAKRDIVVFGGSAGAIEALVRLARELPRDLQAACFVVVHFPEGHETALPQILAHAGGMDGAIARDGAPLEAGRFHVAPPGYHLLLEPDRMRVLRGPRENRFRPSIDVLFRSAAVAFGPRAIGVILSGTLDDGKAGLEAIDRGGGRTLVQSPEDALFPELPNNTLGSVPVGYRLPISGMARALAGMVQEECPAEIPPIADLCKEIRMIKESGYDPQLVSEIGELSPLKCPDCGGALREIRNTALLRFRCHLGHAYSAESMEANAVEDTEKALWQTVELFKEQAMLFEGMAGRFKDGDPERAARFEANAGRAQRKAEILEKLAKEILS